MIPSIETIVTGLLSGEYTASQAIAWLNDHIQLTTDRNTMTEMRDNFAACAMQGIVTRDYNSADDLAAESYWVADAMLKARLKP